MNSTLTSAKLRLIRWWNTLHLLSFDSRCFRKPLFTQSQIVPSSKNQDVNRSCHTSKGNWLLSKIRNFWQSTHLYESSSNPWKALGVNQRYCSLKRCAGISQFRGSRAGSKMATIFRANIALRSLARRTLICRFYSSKFVCLQSKELLYILISVSEISQDSFLFRWQSVSGERTKFIVSIFSYFKIPRGRLSMIYFSFKRPFKCRSLQNDWLHLGLNCV